MAFSPCFSKSLSSAQITASLSLLREPRSLPARLPDSPGCQRLVGMSLHPVVAAQHYDSVGDSAIWPNTDAKRTELCIFADTVVTYVLRYGYGLGGPLCYVRLRLPI